MPVDYQRHQRKAARRSFWRMAYPVVLGAMLGVGIYFVLERPAARASDAPTAQVHRPARVGETRETTTRPAQTEARRAEPQRAAVRVHRPSFSYPNCDAARAAGADPVYRGEGGYGPHLDGDNDGIGCEPHRRR